MKPFTTKISFFIAFILSPYAILCIIFFVTDPFRLNTYPPYLDGRHHINRGLATTNGVLSKTDINSIILGSSRSISLRCDDWQAIDPSCTNCYHFDASADNLFGFEQKARLLSTHLKSLQQVLIVLDENSVQTEPFRPKEFPFVRHPVYEELTEFEFYWVFLKQYLNLKYQWAHLIGNHNLGKHWVQEFSYADCTFDSITGDYITAKESWIQQDSAKYFAENWVFDNQPQDNYYDIQEEQFLMLTHTIKTFEAMGAKCTIIFQPRYMKTHPSKSSLEQISKLLPQTKIIDASHFSFINENPGFWYEQSHFRPIAGRMIFDSIASDLLIPHDLQ